MSETSQHRLRSADRAGLGVMKALCLSWLGGWAIGLGANTLYWVAGQTIYLGITHGQWAPDPVFTREILGDALGNVSWVLFFSMTPGIVLLAIADRLAPQTSRLRRPVWAGLCGGLTGCVLFLILLETVFRPTRFDLTTFNWQFFIQVYGKNLFTAFLTGGSATWVFTILRNRRRRRNTLARGRSL